MAQLPIHKHPFINAAYVASGELTVIRKEGGENLQAGRGNC